MEKNQRNRVKCLLCGDIIESRYRHHLVECSCGNAFVDGGNDYWRCGGKNIEMVKRINEDDEERPL